jgi:hypothetical protein
LVERLGRQAKDLPAAQPHFEQLAAIRTGRRLLDATDPVAPLRVAVAQCLRDAVNEGFEELTRAYDGALSTLAQNETWKKLSAGDQSNILHAVGLVKPPKPDIANDESLLAHVEAHPLSTIRMELDAVSGRLQQAIERAAKLLEPKVTSVLMESTTLRTEDDVHGWLDRTKTRLIDAVRRGPVLIK